MPVLRRQLIEHGRGKTGWRDNGVRSVCMGADPYPAAVSELVVFG